MEDFIYGEPIADVMEEAEPIYNRHCIAIRNDGAIIDAWSDGPRPGKDASNAICINEQGGYQFRMAPGGEENPPICTEDVYKWDGEKTILRTQNEIETDRTAIPAPPPSAQEQLRADVDFIAAMMGVGL